MINMRRYIGGMLCFALLLASAPNVRAADAATEQLLSKARSLEGRGRLDLAARAWEQTLLADPNNSEALLGLAKFAKQSGNVEQANRYLEKLRHTDPTNPAIGTVEGMRSGAMQRSGLEEAGRMAADQNFEGAMRIYRSLYGNEPPAGRIAIGYYETEASTPGGWKDAVAGMERLANEYPQSEDYRLSLGRLETYRQTTRQAGMETLATIKGDTQLVKSARAAWRQALVWDAGNAASRPSLEAYLARYPDPELQKLMAAAPKTGTVEIARNEHPQTDNAETGVGYRFLNAEKLNDAEKHFRSALQETPHNPSALAGLGYLRMKQGDFSGAAKFFTQSLELQPKSKTVVEALATARYSEQLKAGDEGMKRNDPGMAVDHFGKALAMRPNSEQAAESLAGAYMLAQQPAKAAPLYEKLIRMKPQSVEDWFGLVKAKYQSGSGAEALTTLKNAPSQVKDDWAKNPEYVALLSFIYADAGEPDQAKQMFERAIAAARGGKTELPVYQQLQFAGLSVRAGRSSQAADAFLQIAAQHPSNVDAWTGAIGALLEIPDSARAYEALQRIPQNVYAVALTRANFLRSLARLQMSMRRYDLAEKSLNEAIRIDTLQGTHADLDTRLQLAELAGQLHKTTEAESLLRGMSEEYPNDKRTWIALIALLHEVKSDTAAVAVIEKIPAETSAEAQTDPGFVALEASVYASAGQKERALSLVRGAQKHFKATGHGVPVTLDVQLAWLLLDNQDGQPELSKLLARDNKRTDLTETERRDFNQVQSVWSQRRAQAAIQANDYPKAISILQETAALSPHDARLQATLASTFLRAENLDKAFDAYQKWDLEGATVGDFRGAVGAASATHHDKIAADWLARGLTAYPGSPLLLQLAGEQAVQHRDYKLANSCFRQALAKLPTEGATPAKETLESALPAQRQEPAAEEKLSGSSILNTTLNTTLDTTEDGAGTGYAAKIPSASDVLSVDPRDRNALADGPKVVRVSMPVKENVLDNESGVTTAAGSDTEWSNRAFSEGAEEASSAVEHNPVAPEESSAANPNPAGLVERIQAELDAVEGRNTPYFQDGVNVQQRSGEGGFDKLFVEEAHLEASTTVADRTRLTLIATPTYADSGAAALPGATGHLGFGTTAVDGTPSARTAFGIAGEAQLATTDFGLKLGLTPYEFLVHSWEGGLRWNPASGPFTFLVDRDPVRETMLSFAGERDPSTRQVWGGVMANTAAVTGNWSHGATGYYAKLDYQDIEGKSVEKNSRIEVNVGSYFKVLRNKQGELTVGLNLAGMHYDNNLRYFTLGQGGYFSPQQYFLVNVPVQWTGNLNQKLQYAVSASVGVQHFVEDASPYFPTDSVRQAASGLYYPSNTNTGGNYNLGFRTIYQITPQWLGGAFFDVNNANEYRSVSAGIYLKYLLKPRDASAGLSLTAVPDWTGASPYKLR